MPQNLELKAALPSLARAERSAQRLRARRSGHFRQRDTYFDFRNGRLKLREARPGSSELIRYIRPDRAGPRYSEYTLVRVGKPAEIKRVLKALLGITVVVKKRRTVFLFQNARIHLDRVEGLGRFIEFEVVVRRGKTQARRMMKFLTTEFGVRNTDRIRWSYSDLLLKTGNRSQQ